MNRINFSFSLKLPFELQSQDEQERMLRECRYMYDACKEAGYGRAAWELYDYFWSNGIYILSQEEEDELLKEYYPDG